MPEDEFDVFAKFMERGENIHIKCHKCNDGLLDTYACKVELPLIAELEETYGCKVELVDKKCLSFSFPPSK